MTDGAKRPAWTTRGLTSLLLGFLGLVVVGSGVALYFSPRGREAHWVDWRVLGLDKGQWSGVHMVSALVFVVGMGVHAVYNVRPLVRYAVGRRGQGMCGLSRELGVAVGMTVLLVGLAIAEWPPVSLLGSRSEKLKADYAAAVSRAPWPHAEEATVAAMARHLGLSLPEALGALDRAGLPSDGGTETLVELGRRHGVSPARLYEVLRKLAPAAVPEKTHRCGKGGAGTPLPARSE